MGPYADTELTEQVETGIIYDDRAGYFVQAQDGLGWLFADTLEEARRLRDDDQTYLDELFQRV